MAEQNEQKDQSEKAQQKEREQRENRSPRYPSFGLSEAIPLAQKLWDKERRTMVPPDVAVKAWGYSSLSGIARTKLATMKQYGLLDEDRQGVRVSDLALEILQREAGSEQYQSAVRQAGLKPDLFKQLATALPEASNDALRRELVFRRGFLDAAADQVIKAYRDTVSLIGPSAPEPEEKEPYAEAAAGERKSPTLPPGMTRSRPANLGGAGFGAYEPAERAYVWPLPNGVIAEVKFTGPAGPVHFDFLQQYLELAKKAVTVEQAGSSSEGAAGSGEEQS